MYFKRLEIFGFKSFADRTVLNFEPGITAIVGPNGCGKSNIFDAIRWVLGEQSTKELRGSSMEDVIFNGTAQKPSLGFAEVNMVFSNESRALPIEYDEVTITRRLFRSGESEYMLNKTVVRLKDIQELLMGTGIGAEAYSLVQQGKVDLVVSAKPEDRRMIFDEAAGITKYKFKKREALNKLKDTENNLLRINDIIIEVRRQIASTERQADKARKYKEEFQRLEKLEVALARYQTASFQERQSVMSARTRELEAKRAEIAGRMEEGVNLLSHETDHLEEIDQKISGLHAEEIRMDGQIDLNNRQIGFNEERVQGINRNDQKLKEQKEHLIARCRAQQEKIEDLRRTITALEETVQFNEQSLGEKRDLLGRFESLIKESKEKISGNEEKILTLTSQQVSLRNELTDIMKEIQGGLARKRRLEIEGEKIGSERESFERRMQELDGGIGRVHEDIRNLQNQRDEQGGLLDQLRAELAALKQRIDDLERKALFYKSQKDFIEKLHAQYNDIPDPLIEGRLITSAPPMDHHTGIIGKVKEVQLAQNGRSGFLREIFNKADAQQLYEIVCEAKFIELDPHQISRQIEEIDVEIQQLNSEKEKYVAGIEVEAQKYKEIQQAIHDKERVLSALAAQREDLQQKLVQLEQELELNSLELVEVRETLASAGKKEEELDYRLDTVTQDIEWCQNDIKDKQQWIADKSQEKEDVTVSIAQIETEIESQKEKLKDSSSHQEMFSRDLDGRLEEIKKIDDECAAEAQRLLQIEEENRTLTEKIETLKRGQESLREVLNSHQAQKEDLAQRIHSHQADFAAFEKELSALQQDIHDQELKSQELAFAERGIKDRLQQAYRINFDEMIQQQAASPDSAAAPEAFDEEETLQEIERLRKRCEAFGSVNLVAIEEYEDLKGRFEFLTKQQSDLLEAKSQLMDTIQKINRSTRQMFMDTFAKVGEEFRVHFRMLFGGGEAQLVLLDPENVLESGIDIIARPPGKKLQNISLLSGGEKTLTAIALIFGVFKVNPSPFCILDEIDAALDDSNVGRFSYLLKEFARIAQFIVITHNKKTIASAGVMYGITMPETGVSRIVSVKFADGDKKEVEALAAV